MTEEECIRRLRAIGDEMDEVAASIHPSAWNEVLAPYREQWRKVAAMETEDDETPTQPVP